MDVKQLIQVTLSVSSEDEVEKQEVKSLIKTGGDLKCKDLLMVTWDYEDEIGKGIKWYGVSF